MNNRISHSQRSIAKKSQKPCNMCDSKHDKKDTQDSNISYNTKQITLHTKSNHTQHHIAKQHTKQGDSNHAAQKPLKNLSSLKNSFEFDIVFKSQVKFHKDFMTIHGITLHDFTTKLYVKKSYSRIIDSHILFGFSINKKVAKAHTRNLIRRRIKAILQKLILQQKISHLVLLFVCRKGIVELDFHTLEKHLDFALSKILYALQSHSHKKNAISRNDFLRK